MSIVSVAKQLGVSKSTVWRALKGSKDINPETRERILRGLAEYGHQPNSAARALVTGKSGMVTIWVPGLSTGHVGHVLQHAQEQVSRACREMIVRSREAYHSSDPYELMQWPVDGILAYDVVDVVELLRPFITSQTKRTPLVSFGPYCATNVDAVGVDLREGVTNAVLHLAEEGCRKIAYAVPAAFRSSDDARCQGYLAGIEMVGQKPRFVEGVSGSRIEGRRAILGAYKKERYDGLFCFSDEMALGVYRGIREMGLRIPDDVAIVGCDGIEELEYMDCPLSSLQQPYEDMCRLAWQFLEHRIECPTAPLQFQMLKAPLIVKDSSRRGARSEVVGAASRKAAKALTG